MGREGDGDARERGSGTQRTGGTEKILGTSIHKNREETNDKALRNTENGAANRGGAFGEGGGSEVNNNEIRNAYVCTKRRLTD